MLTQEEIIKDFPILKVKVHGKRLVYIDNAATTQKPIQVINAIKQYYEDLNANVHRGVHYLSEAASEEYEDAHRKVAKFLNANGMEEIIFTRNTTESLNLLAYTLGLNELKKGDKVVVTRFEHHSNLIPWQQMTKRAGAQLEFIEITEDGRLDMASAEKVIDDRTKIVSIVHMSNALGTILPVKEVSKLAHEHGAYMIVDGAQSTPHMPVDVKELDVDFFAFSGHKMLAPMGIGGLFGKEELLEKMHPFLFGGDMIKFVTYEDAQWNHLPWKFEAGTPNVSGGIGLKVAIEYLEKVGFDTIHKIESELTTYAYERLSELPYIKIYGPEPKYRGAVISFTMEGIHPHDIATLLDEDGIAVRAGHHCAQPLMTLLKTDATTRASFYLYNTKEDVDILIESLQKIYKLFNQ